MKNFIILCLAFIALTVSCNNPSSTNEAGKTDTTSFQSIDTTRLAKGVVYYQCPMHPEVISDKPGTCPKCEMELEKKEKS